MNIRCAKENDIPGVLTLQDLNLVSKISDEQKKDGFVTTPFVEDQLMRLIAQNGLFVIEHLGRIQGYAAAAGWDYFAGRPMFDYMISRFKKITYQGLQITPANSFQYGPVCVDKGLRGTGSFPALFEFMKTQMTSRYPLGTTFINKINPRSYRAHTEKAGIEVIDEFEFNGSNYWGLAFLTR